MYDCFEELQPRKRGEVVEDVFCPAKRCLETEKPATFSEKVAGC